MNVLLVNTMVTLNGWSSYYTGRRSACSLPHGLLSIATVLNQNGHNCRILDMRQYADMNTFLMALDDVPFDVLGVGPMSVDFGVTLELLEQVRLWFPDVTTVVGGVHATMFPGEVPERLADYVVLGEGEQAMIGITDRATDAWIHHACRLQPPNLGGLPYIDRTLVDYERGELCAPMWAGKAPYVTMMAGRGCPFKCGFCHPVSPTMFGKVRQRSTRHVIGEMEYLAEQYGAAYFDFIDDTFTIDRGWVREFCTFYDSLLGIPFVISSRADLIVKWPDMFQWLSSAGCDAVSVGFESGNARILALRNKGTTRAMNLEAAAILRANGLKIVANVMYGVPTETVEEARDTATMVQEIAPDVTSTAFFTPYPGCDLATKYAELSLIEDYADMHRCPNKPKVRGVDYGGIVEMLKEFAP